MIRSPGYGLKGPKGDTGLKGDAGAIGPAGPKGDVGTAGAAGSNGAPGLTFLGNVTVSETLLISLSLGMKRMTLPLTGVATGTKILAVPNGTPSAGCEVVNAYPASANNVSIGYYVPALGIGATYTIPVSVYRVS